VIADRVKVFFQSGRGGDPSSILMRLSSRKSVGGGGDGGKGGSIIVRVDSHFYDLSKFSNNKKFVAANGECGRAQNKKGKEGEDVYIGVPSGTRLIENDKILVDLIGDKKEFLICRGGRGGLGNFKRDYVTSPEPGEFREIILDYRIPADVAILGFANTGKTSLLNLLCGQKHKVAEYPYTTTSCSFALAKFGDITIMDCPPLTAYEGDIIPKKQRFLRHLLRVKVFFFLSDNIQTYKADFKALADCITKFEPDFLKEKKIFYLLSKVDTIDKSREVKDAYPVSSLSPKSLEKVQIDLSNYLKKLKKSNEQE